ncbi:hypothetical protein KH172YL63_40370 [Bacillus sp. KH172YL63]|nr:hypothetical protein KH172YL63_40370 [Bacillus sp. KH172YL63]
MNNPVTYKKTISDKLIIPYIKNEVRKCIKKYVPVVPDLPSAALNQGNGYALPAEIN